MYRKISALLLSTVLTSYAVASDDLNPETSQVSLKAHYDNHPANKENKLAEGTFEKNLPLDLVPKLCSFMDFRTAVRFVTTCKKFMTKRNRVLIDAIPRFYEHIGYHHRFVFINIDHPQWTPWALPDDVALKLHYQWFGRANKLMSKKELSDEEIILSYRLFYSAGRLGHMLAATAAGKMLLCDRFSKVLPAVTLSSDLEPESEKWDVRRLNRPKTGNVALEKILDSMWGAFYDIDCDYDSTDTDTTEEEVAAQNLDKRKTIIRSALEQLASLEETMEIKIVIMSLNERLEHMNKHNSVEWFRPVGTAAYAEEAQFSSPLVNSIIAYSHRVGSKKGNSLTTELFKGVLNYEFVEDYAESLNDEIYARTKSDSESDDEFYWFNQKEKDTPEAKTAKDKQHQLTMLSCLLGNKNPFFDTATVQQMEKLSYVIGWYYPTLKLDDPNPELRIISSIASYSPVIFLYNLMLTRSPTLETYSWVRGNLQWLLSIGNTTLSERIALMDQHFNYEGGTESASYEGDNYNSDEAEASNDEE